jgi:hypothetical protein
MHFNAVWQGESPCPGGQSKKIGTLRFRYVFYFKLLSGVKPFGIRGSENISFQGLAWGSRSWYSEQVAQKIRGSHARNVRAVVDTLGR